MPVVDVGEYLPDASRSSRDRSQRIPGMPPAAAQSLLPHAITFQGIFSSVSRVYRMSDEALKASLDQARYMLNDPVITEPLYYRLRCLALLDWHLEPEDKKNPTEQWLCTQLTAILKRTPRFTQYRKALARAVWFGRYAVQHKWGWQKVLGERRLCIVKQQPVHGDKLVFRYDDGTGRYDPEQVGIRVGAGFNEGATIANRWRIEDMKKIEPTDRGLAYFLSPWEKELLLAVHKSEIEDGEYEDPQSAGKICGTGLRSMVYWTWYQKQELMVELLTYLDRSATGIEIMFYPIGNKTAREEARKALESRIGENGNALLIPRPEENPGAFGYDRIEPGMQGAGVLKEIIVDLFNHQIKRSIIGQTLTTETDSTGLGSNLADIHKDTFLQIIKEDATNEEETLTTDAMRPVLKCNFPKYQNVGIRFRIDTETENTEERIQALLECAQAGLPIKRQSLYDTLGEAKPDETDEVIGGEAAQQGAGMLAGMPPPGDPGAQPPKRAMVQGGLGANDAGDDNAGGTGEDDDAPYSDEEQQAAMEQALELDGSTSNANPSENSNRRVKKLYSAGDHDVSGEARDDGGRWTEGGGHDAAADREEKKRRVPFGTHTDIKSLVKEVLSETRGEPNQKDRWIKYALVGKEEAAKLKEVTGEDFEGYTHLIDASHVNHAFERHGPESDRLASDEIPLTQADFEKIPEVISTAERIALLPAQEKHPQPVIRYVKRVNGYFIVLEEMRTGRRALAMTSIYKTTTDPAKKTE